MKQKYVIGEHIKYQNYLFLLHDYKYSCFLSHKYFFTFISMIEMIIMKEQINIYSFIYSTIRK